MSEDCKIKWGHCEESCPSCNYKWCVFCKDELK